jgi:hypothetical protein
MGYTSSHHFESLEMPVASGYGANEARGYVIALKLHGVIGVKFGGSRGLLQNFINRGFQISVVSFEKVLEQKR